MLGPQGSHMDCLHTMDIGLCKQLSFMDIGEETGSHMDYLDTMDIEVL